MGAKEERVSAVRYSTAQAVQCLEFDSGCG